MCVDIRSEVQRALMQGCVDQNFLFGGDNYEVASTMMSEVT